jgi:hypothetical protein
MMNSSLVFLLEDDYDQSASITRALRRNGFQIVVLDSEFAFRRWLARPSVLPFAVVLDVYVRYGSLEGLNGGLPNPQEAGFRCQAQLAEAYPEVATIFYSQFPRSDTNYGGERPYLMKSAGSKPLCSLLKSLAGGNSHGLGFIQ